MFMNDDCNSIHISWLLFVYFWNVSLFLAIDWELFLIQRQLNQLQLQITIKRVRSGYIYTVVQSSITLRSSSFERRKYLTNPAIITPFVINAKQIFVNICLSSRNMTHNCRYYALISFSRSIKIAFLL